jgi:hypothetical protein
VQIGKPYPEKVELTLGDSDTYEAFKYMNLVRRGEPAPPQKYSIEAIAEDGTRVAIIGTSTQIARLVSHLVEGIA